MLRLEFWRDYLRTTVERQGDNVSALLERKRDVRLHDGDRADVATAERVKSNLGGTDVLEHDLVSVDRAFQQTYRRVVRSSVVIDTDRHAGEIAWRLQGWIERHDGLCHNRRP